MIAQVSTLAFFAGLAAAVHAPVGEPSGNAINAPLVEIVPACKPYTIKWTPSTPNTVSLLLLRGPSTNIVPLGAPLVEGIANSGSFVWTPSSSLEADTTHYGLQIIDDVTGQYQYSTQFGISKDLCEAEVVSTTAEPVTEATATDEGYGYGYPTATPEVSSTEEGGYSVPSSTAEVPFSSVEVPISSVEVPVSSVAASVSSFVATGTGAVVSSIIQPTKSLTVPASLKTTATVSPTTTAPPSEFTGAASGIQAGLGLAGAVAGLVFML